MNGTRSNMIYRALASERCKIRALDCVLCSRFFRSRMNRWYLQSATVHCYVQAIILLSRWIYELYTSLTLIMTLIADVVMSHILFVRFAPISVGIIASLHPICEDDSSFSLLNGRLFFRSHSVAVQRVYYNRSAWHRYRSTIVAQVASAHTCHALTLNMCQLEAIYWDISIGHVSWLIGVPCELADWKLIGQWEEISYSGVRGDV